MTVRVVESHPPLTAEPFHATALVAEEYELTPSGRHERARRSSLYLQGRL